MAPEMLRHHAIERFGRCVSLSALVTSCFIACGDDDDSSPGAGGSGGADAGVGATGGNGNATGGADASIGAQGGTGGSGGAQGGTGGGVGGAQGGAAGDPGGGGGVGGVAGASDGGGAAGTDGSSGPTLIDECPGPLDSAVAAALAAGGPVDAQMKWLYPYDKTVFPRGLRSPVLQWSPAAGTAPTATYVRLHTRGFEYRGCFGPLDPVRLPLSQQAWDQATSAANGVGTPLVVELTTSVGGVVSGPIVQSWTIAPARLKGVVFYDTYDSPQVGNNGAVMRMLIGQAPQPYLTVPGGLAPLGPCVSCHGVSANGERMVAEKHQYPGIQYTSASYPAGAAPNPSAITALDAAGFGAVYPDGSRVMTMGSPSSSTNPLFPFGSGNVAGMVGPRVSRLFDMATGANLAPAGWTVQYAKMPMFSPDGTKIVFNHHDAGNGHSLAVMSYSRSTNTFSNLVPIYQHAQLFPGWPFFTPDNKGVVFALGAADDYVSAHPLRPTPSSSELYYVDIATMQAVRLSHAGGFEGTQSYLPYPGRDEQWDFFPSVSPVAAGGYFWVFFTSRRNYGNVSVGSVDIASSKKIWVSAIDIDAPAGTDPSHPAFYLPEQEATSGNFRPVAALAPCKNDGSQCATGVECCCGGCASGTCGCPQGCSQIDEKCATAADCCDSSARCIAGFCAQ